LDAQRFRRQPQEGGHGSGDCFAYLAIGIVTMSVQRFERVGIPKASQ
jgi:hypothetical protein